MEPDELEAVLARRAEVVDGRAVGRFRFVALDLEGFRSGSMNRLLPEANLEPPSRDHEENQ